MAWTREVKNKVLDSFLLMEDGNYLLQENQSKILLLLGWVIDEKNIVE